MLQDPFPSSGPDDAGPDDAEPDSDASGPQQGLFITLPAEELTLSGFAQNGQADTMAPGALLGTIFCGLCARPPRQSGLPLGSTFHRHGKK